MHKVVYPLTLVLLCLSEPIALRTCSVVLQPVSGTQGTSDMVGLLDYVQRLIGIPEDMSSDPAARGVMGIPQPQRKPGGLLGMSEEPTDNIVSQLSSYIDSNFPASRYPGARAAMLGTIVSEAGEDMRFDQEQRSGGPGYGLFQMERPHYRRYVGNKIYSRLKPTEAEKARGFKPYLDTVGARYNKFLKNNKLQDSAQSQIKFMSDRIKKNKQVMEAFKSPDPSKAIDALTGQIIKPRAYLNKSTRQAELKRRRRAAGRF